jgi:hypothetical protein
MKSSRYLPTAFLAGLTALALLAGGPAVAAAVSLPAAATGRAHTITYGSATLAGSVNPRGSNTTYYFQYGPTKTYGAQTALADAGAGIHTISVRVPISGLQPLTRYHFRLIAVNAAGAATGADSSFTTAKVPLSLALLAAPNPVLYGAPVVIQGTLSGTGNGGREVVLQANPFPYSQGFANVGNPVTTFASGGFSFTLASLTQATQFRVLTTTKPQIVSPVVTAGVAVRISAHIGRTHRRHHARIYGTVTPAVDGMEVGIMRAVRGRNVLVAGTTLRHRNATSSRFSRKIRVRKGLYRVLVRVTNGAQTSNYSAPLLIR